jgi:ABC-type enterochelin transport system permease subunit
MTLAARRLRAACLAAAICAHAWIVVVGVVPRVIEAPYTIELRIVVAAA